MDDDPPPVCAWCRVKTHYVHGHVACVNGLCPMYGVDQGPCCDGENAEQCPLPTPEIVRRREH